MTELIQKEGRNFQFDFLRQTHSLFSVFTKFVEQYTKILIPPKNIVEEFKFYGDSRFGVLDRCFERSEWEIFQKESKQREEAEVQAERGMFIVIGVCDQTSYS